MYAAPCVEISIYSTCKRISQKLLRNCVKFLHTIHDVLREPYMEYARKSMDEIEIIGPEGRNDYRKLNSYPSKVRTSPGRSARKVARACEAVSLLVGKSHRSRAAAVREKSRVHARPLAAPASGRACMPAKLAHGLRVVYSAFIIEHKGCSAGFVQHLAVRAALVAVSTHLTAALWHVHRRVHVTCSRVHLCMHLWMHLWVHAHRHRRLWT
jgi:hypothetical protein